MFKPVNPKISFPEMENEILKKWDRDNVIEEYLKKNQSSQNRFSFFDGPITANNPMGVHHAWGRTYKDIWQRFWNMRGYAQRFQNGFDCQGLWVEVEVEKELGIRNKKDIENLVPGDKKASIEKFVSLCKERVLKFSKIQTEQSKRLAYFMDWDNSYFTMSDENNYMIWHFLKVAHEKGWIYKGMDNVPWCPRCETAISQHEMLTEDYKEVTHESVFVKFPITNLPHVIKSFDKSEDVNQNLNLLVWTTTPWTIPANAAVGVNKNFEYEVWQNNKTNEKIIFIGKDADGNLPERVLKGKKMSVSNFIFKNVTDEYSKIGLISGSDLIGAEYEAPFDSLPIVINAKKDKPHKFHKVIDASDIVVSQEGTGLLHLAPGAGKEDFDLGKKENLPVISPIDDRAVYVDDMGEFGGKNAKKHPELIIDYLKVKKDGKFLFKTLHYTHRYPACWRCKTELVWKVTNEWYIAMDRPSRKASDGKANHTLREQMVETAKKIKWIPDFGLDRELDWLKNMHDWLISKKNRYWGLALPIYECSNCGNFEVIGSKAELKERAVEGWDDFENKTPHKPFIDDVKVNCPKCSSVVPRIDDVGNVWLDAGIIPFSTLIDPEKREISYTGDQKYWKKWFPADFITESFPGQFKNWFYSLIAMSTVLEETNSFKIVMGFASVLAEDGRPMHKSWGNAIEFNEGAEKIGVDVMRWLYATADPEQNLLFGYKHADDVRRRFHLMLWNIYNFFVTYANVDEWDNDIAKFAAHQSENTLDTWIVSRLHNTIKSVNDNLEKYDAQKASLAIDSFVQDLSLWYIRRSRDRVGPVSTEPEDKKAFYETTYAVLIALSKIMAPFMPFIADEIYTNITGEKSVHLAHFPQFSQNLINPDLEAEMKNARELASLILMKRKNNGIKVRIPIKKIEYSGPEKLQENILKIVKEEVNVNEISWSSKTEKYEVVTADQEFVDVNNQDLEMGLAREIVRQIQEERKKIGTAIDEKVDVVIDSWPLKYENFIILNAQASSLQKGNFAVQKAQK